MSLLKTEYLEVNLIGVILLFTMLLFVKKKHNSKADAEQVHFIRMLILNAMLLLTDNGIYLLNGHTRAEMFIWMHICCISYFGMHTWFCYEWVRFEIERLFPGHRATVFEKWVLLFPAIVCTIAILLNPETKWFYLLSADNVYCRGPLLWVIFAVAVLYLVISYAIVLKELTHPKRNHNSGVYRTILIFPIPLAIGYLIQMRFYGISVIWICAAISMLVLFINMQNDQLSIDPLSGLYNRGQTDVQLRWEVEHIDSMNDVLFVVMMDVDHFKFINDKFGHLSGDQAISYVSDIIQKNTRKGDFAGRFGGDEFLMIGHAQRSEDVDGILLRIKKALEEANATGKFPYALSLSAGYAIAMPQEHKTADEILAVADRNMYEMKHKRDKEAAEEVAEKK